MALLDVVLVCLCFMICMTFRYYPTISIYDNSFAVNIFVVIVSARIISFITEAKTVMAYYPGVGGVDFWGKMCIMEDGLVEFQIYYKA